MSSENPMTFEVNFDGLVGPTHNYSGLSHGNLPSVANRSSLSNPKKAALQGIQKMRLLTQMGIKQAFIPPQARPDFEAIRRAGYSGTDKEILEKIAQQDPSLLATYSSSSSMWVANAATISPSADSSDGLLHITPANLATQPHRAIECSTTSKILQAIFYDQTKFKCHHALPQDGLYFDEGAANHMRIAPTHGLPGIEMFVYSKKSDAITEKGPQIYPARQSLEASQAIAKQHGLKPEQVIFAQQNPRIIDAGGFHNDLVAVSNENVFLYHENAFDSSQILWDEIHRKYESLCGQKLHEIQILNDQLSLDEAIQSYLFNGQIVTLPDKSMALILPEECKVQKVEAVIQSILESDNPIQRVEYIDLRESMRNGGGPACLRLRICMTQDEFNSLPPGYIATVDNLDKIEQWIHLHYRDRLTENDLKDYQLFQESQRALTELTQILL